MDYKQIADYPTNYSSGNIISRFIDGLIFRYYWVTEGLTPSDLSFKPSKSGQSVSETLAHICWLAYLVNQSSNDQESNRSMNAEFSSMSFTEMRNYTMNTFREASIKCSILKEEDLNAKKVVIVTNHKSYSYPFWHMMNGPLSDALYHTGQIVSFRRTNGNPIAKGVNVFSGKGPSL